MKQLLLFPMLLWGATLPAQRVFITEFAGQAEVRVFETEFAGQADLKVYKVSYEGQASGNSGRWFFADKEGQADKKITFTGEGSADLKIHFVRLEGLAGWNNSSKKHLME